jgi:HD superfamily phosphohydrolase
MKFHENRSSLLLEYIINNNENLKNKISQDHINFIKSIINPKNGETGFIYQIVSNYLNGIDVDKCDYIARDTTAIGLQYNLDFTRLVDDIEVIDNNICYPKQMAYELVCLYTTRYRLHKQIYRHKVTISTQFMINEIMELLDPIIGISKSLDCPIKFSTLTDDYIFSMCDTLMISKHLLTDENRLRVEHANDLHQKILRRKLYKYVGSIITDKYQNIDISKLDIQHDNVMIYNSRISSGSKNDPLENIWFYNKKKPNAKFKIDKNDVSIVLPIIQSEFVWMAFLIEENANDRDNINIFINSFKNN